MKPSPKSSNGHAEPRLADDLLSTAAEIAAELGWTVRRTRHALERRRIPARKDGGLWFTTRSALRRHFTPEASGASDKAHTATEGLPDATAPK